MRKKFEGVGHSLMGETLKETLSITAKKQKGAIFFDVEFPCEGVFPETIGPGPTPNDPIHKENHTQGLYIAYTLAQGGKSAKKTNVLFVLK